jgi:hypothetical protein
MLERSNLVMTLLQQAEGFWLSLHTRLRYKRRWMLLTKGWMQLGLKGKHTDATSLIGKVNNLISRLVSTEVSAEHFHQNLKT